MKIVAVIPARLNSTRLNNKLLRDICGKTLIRRTYEATKDSKLFDDVVVVTNSKKIVNELMNYKIKYLFDESEYETGTDRIAAVANEIHADIIINVQGDEPFTESESLKRLIEVFSFDKEKQIDLASLMVKIDDEKEINNSNCVKVITDKDNFALYFSRSVIPFNRSFNKKLNYYKHKGVYAFRKATLLEFTNLPILNLEESEKIECLRFLEHGKKIKMVESNVQGVEIDTPSDLEKAISLWKS